jgi:hypothetical protein
MRFVCAVLLASAALLSGRSAAGVAAPPARDVERPIRSISIVINGEPLVAPDAPRVVAGRLLIPTRDVFNALGIVVTRSGDVISARLPTGSVTMTIGSSRVRLTGRDVRLDGPLVEIGGTTYAPLKLLSAVFGAQVSYDQLGGRIEIISGQIGRTNGAESSRAGGGSNVQGVVSAVDSDSAPPTITVVRGGQARTIAVNSDAKIWTEDVTIRSQLKATLADIHVGDALHAILAQDGRVVSLYDFFRSTSGTIVAISPAAIVLENGRVVTPGSATDIALNGAAAKLTELREGDYVTVRSNPETGEMRQIIASRKVPITATAQPVAAGGPVAVAITSFVLSATRPLRAGESFDVTLMGTPGGTASFDIGDYLTAQPMREIAPGSYSGQFTIPDRFNVTQVPLYGNLTVGGTAAPRAEAQGELSASTTPPLIGEVAPSPGQSVNSSRPSIYATYSVPTGIAIKASSATITVNGHDVTASATRTSNFITYSPPADLPDGPITVNVRVADEAGNTATRSWTFSVKKSGA